MFNIAVGPIAQLGVPVFNKILKSWEGLVEPGIKPVNPGYQERLIHHIMCDPPTAEQQW